MISEGGLCIKKVSVHVIFLGKYTPLSPESIHSEMPVYVFGQIKRKLLFKNIFKTKNILFYNIKLLIHMCSPSNYAHILLGSCWIHFQGQCCTVQKFSIWKRINVVVWIQPRFAF